MTSHPFERHSSLWFQDGNIVLIAGNVGFRVHQGVLSRHSAFFRDMFSLPQPQSATDLFEECPLVRMDGEDPQDFSTVLSIIYDGGQNFYRESIVLPFDTVAAALHIGTKFMFSDIRDEAVARLSACFPADLDAFIALVDTHPPSKGRPAAPSKLPIQLTKLDATAVFHLARSLDLKKMIPAAIYFCAQLSVEQLFTAHRNPTKFRTLTLDELQECFEEQKRLRDDNILLSRWMTDQYDPTSQDCQERRDGKNRECWGILTFLVAKTRSNLAQPSAFKLLGVIEHFGGETPAIVLCPSCIAFLRERCRRERNRIWVRLLRRYVGDTDDAGAAA